MGDTRSPSVDAPTRPSVRDAVVRLAPRTWLALAAAAAGAVLLFMGWWGVSGESLVALQLPYLASASIPGAALVVAAAVLLRGTTRPVPADARVDALYALLTEPDPSAPPTAGSTAPPTAGSTAGSTAVSTPRSMATGGGDDVFVSVAGGTRYHRPECALVAGKPTETVSPEAIPDGALSACPVCLGEA